MPGWLPRRHAAFAAPRRRLRLRRAAAAMSLRRRRIFTLDTPQLLMPPLICHYY